MYKIFRWGVPYIGFECEVTYDIVASEQEAIDICDHFNTRVKWFETYKMLQYKKEEQKTWENMLR